MGEIKDIIIKTLQNTASAGEQKQLRDWLAESDINKRYFSEIEYAWQASSLLYKTSGFDQNAAWQKFGKVMNTSGKKSKILGLVSHPIYKYAAIFIVAFLLGSMINYGVFSGVAGDKIAKHEQMQEITAPLGSRSKIILPDGTEVWLNAGSKLKYANSYNTDHRNVYLQGEGFFSVIKNPKKPFIVKASDISIKAYGTTFNVKAYADEGIVTTTLVEGIVKVEGYHKNRQKFEISLKPNEMLTYYKKDPNMTVKSETAINPAEPDNEKVENNNTPVVLNNSINTSLFTSWKDERWIIEREKLENLIVLLGRRYDINIICESEVLKNIPFSGTIRKETLEQVLDIMKLTAPLNYEFGEGVVRIKIDNTRSFNYKNTTEE